MTTHDEHDPVNRWATEHYGFEDEPDNADSGSSGVGSHASVSPSPVPRSPLVAVGRPRRRMALLASGVVGLAMIVGIGGVAAAAADSGDGRGQPGGDRGSITHLDGTVDGPTGDHGGGHR